MTKIYGKHEGRVTKNDLPQGLGWIEVEVPALFPKGPAITARPCFPPGHFWVPPVGAGVWVEFAAGDPASPLWVACFYGEGEVPPEAKKTPPDSRVLHTPSGHVVELADEAGKERVIIRHKENAFVAIDEDGSVVVSSKTGAMLFLNADKDQASVISPQGHSVALTDKGIGLVHSDGKTTVEVKDGKVRVLGKEITLVGNVALGPDASAAFPALIGPALLSWLGTHVHNVTAPAAPSGPPLPPLPPLAPTMLSKTVTVHP